MKQVRRPYAGDLNVIKRVSIVSIDPRHRRHTGQPFNRLRRTTSRRPFATIRRHFDQHFAIVRRVNGLFTGFFNDRATATRRTRRHINHALARQTRTLRQTFTTNTNSLIRRFSRGQRAGNHMRVAFQGIRARTFDNRHRASRRRRTRARRSRHQIFISRTHRQFTHSSRRTSKGSRHSRRRHRFVGRASNNGRHIRKRRHIRRRSLHGS